MRKVFLQEQNSIDYWNKLVGKHIIISSVMNDIVFQIVGCYASKYNIYHHNQNKNTKDILKNNIMPQELKYKAFIIQNGKQTGAFASIDIPTYVALELIECGKGFDVYGIVYKIIKQ